MRAATSRVQKRLISLSYSFLVFHFLLYDPGFSDPSVLSVIRSKVLLAKVVRRDAVDLSGEDGEVGELSHDAGCSLRGAEQVDQDHMLFRDLNSM